MFVLVNTKTYPCDETAVAEAAAAVDPTTDARLAVAPQPTAVPAVAETGVETWAQHVDPIEPGSNTGSILAESVEAAGATGTLLNHSERRRRLDQLEESLDASARAGLETIVCGNTPEQVAAAAALGPDAVAIEPPELIGTGTPVSQADPEIVTEAVAAVDAVDDSVSVLCGAGISTGDDVVAARELGADGVLLASGVAKADDPEAALASLVDPLSGP